MINTILGWIGTFLGWLDSWTHSYLLAMLLFALIVEILMLPFGIKSQKNSIKQAALRPKEMAIRNKYKGRNDKATLQKVNEEVQQMYRDENYNQFSGCLPLLLQLPIILALYNVIINPLQYVMHISSDAINAMTSYVTAAADAANAGLGFELASGRGTISLANLIAEKGLDFFKGLAAFVDAGEGVAAGTGAGYFAEFETAVAKGLPNFNALGLNLAETPSIKQFNWLLIIPVLTFLVYFGSMKLTRLFSYQAGKTGDAATDKATGCSNWAMDIMMPAFSVYICFLVPAAVGVYWIFKSLLGTLKQFILSKVMPIPQFSEEEYKAAERELAGKSDKGKTYKVDFEERMSNSSSLFREDSEDYNSEEENAAIEEKLKKSDSDAPEGGAITRAPLKDDSDKKQ